MSIEQRIAALKLCATKGHEFGASCKGVDIGVGFEEVSSSQLERLDKFPEDFKLFVKEVGLLSVGTWGCAALDVIFPDISLKNFDFSDPGVPSDEGCGLYWGFDRTLYSNHIPVVTWPCDYHSAGYDISKEPHEFIVFTDPDFCELNIRSFLEFVEYQFFTNSDLSVLFEEAHNRQNQNVPKTTSS